MTASLLPFAAADSAPGRATVASLEIWHLGAVYLIRVAPDPLNPQAMRDGQKIEWGEVPSVVRVTAFNAAGLYHVRPHSPRGGRHGPTVQKQEAQQNG